MNYYGSLQGGMGGWIRSVLSPSLQAPLTTALESLVLMITGPTDVAAFAIPIIIGSGCIIVTYWLGNRIGGHTVGTMSALLTALSPEIINYSRSFHFSITATLVLTFTIFSLLKTERFKNHGWILVYSISLGMLPLARSMTLAFIPGIVFATLIYIAVEQQNRGKRFILFLLAMLIAALTSSIWLWSSGKLVAEYLFSFGYGQRAVEFGTEQSKFGIDAWRSTIVAFSAEVLFPYFVFFIIGLIAWILWLCNSLYKQGIKVFSKKILTSQLLPIAIILIEIWLALVTTRNKGSAFFLPLVPLLIIFCVLIIYKITTNPACRAIIFSLLAFIALFCAYPLFDLHGIFSKAYFVNAPLIGCVRVIEPRGTIQQYEASGQCGSPIDAEPIIPKNAYQWWKLNQDTAEIFKRLNLNNSAIGFGFRHYIYNVNTVNMHQLMKNRCVNNIFQVEPVLTGESVDGYKKWLEDLKKMNNQNTYLLTTDKPHSDMAPAIIRPFMIQAARDANFKPIKEWMTPDDLKVTLWEYKKN